MNAESERADLNEVRFVTRAAGGGRWLRMGRTIERQMSELTLVLASSDECTVHTDIVRCLPPACLAWILLTPCVCTVLHLNVCECKHQTRSTKTLH